MFIGPCIAKKMEAEGRSRVAGEVDAAITFAELRRVVRRGGHRSGRRRAERLRPAPRLRRRPVSHQPRRAPGGQSPRGPAHRRDRGHAGPQPRAGGDQGVRRRRPRRQAAGSALLRRLHHGRRPDQRPAHVQSPPPGADLRQPADEDLRSRALATRHGGDVAAGPEPHLPGRRPADPRSGPRRGRRDHAPHGQAHARRRAELRGLRLRHLPRARHGDPQAAGRDRDVPAAHHRPAPHGAAGGRVVARPAWPPPRRPSCSRRSWPAWASWPPASPTR